MTGSAFRLSFQPNWQINNGFFNIIGQVVRTQTLVHLQAGGAKTKDFGAVSQTDLTRSLVSPVAQANFNLNTALQETLKIYG